MSKTLLEIAANSVASGIAAQEGGADRIELCAALGVGGITPSHGMMTLARERVHIPIHVLIRPRGGDFLYDDNELEEMQRDIHAAKSIGCEGVVIGTLDADGDVDKARCRELASAASGMHITFHRAIDVCRDPLQALEDIIALGCGRILTSGGQPSADAGTRAIAELVARAAGRIEIMPGGGVTPDNVLAIAQHTGAAAVHASAKAQLASGMRLRAGVLPDMESGASRTDVARVRALVATLHDHTR
ncbi:MAG TPA: copper homeostasis protein CutC [Oleiagrimonas sp.]|nr:copper homeostasis protein CutC [Oleiagrimonas sp.]